ncbi:LOW QUALITY PROTEIN: perilipin-3-like [Gopherus evgoodei]|uniref:LOW QUALITY PROTEIN: perilipin-3-like n=1 Tax=Gopherus evgoodei TaxID=1825980 RepID=UPI0011CFA807|nr:LOW QUALITY PROTEIN: perilipin-3-like [Gopherus evgoodei]
MSSNENDVKDAPSKSGEQEQQNLVNRVASLPLVSAAYDMVSTTYTSIKETHPVIRSICDVAETGVRTITSATVSGALPVLDQQEPLEQLILTASDYTCKSLDKLEEKLPLLQQPGDQVASDAKELVSSTLTDAKDVVCSTDTGVKDPVTSMVGVTKGAVQESMEVTKSAVTSSMSTVLGSSMGQMIMSSVDLLPDTSESLADHYLPMTDEELAKLAVSLEGSGEAPAEQQSYYVRLGSLSSTLHQRAYQHALGKMRQARQRTLEALSQLQQTIDLMERAKQAVDQKAHDGQEKLQQMWLEWHKGQPGFNEDNGSLQPEEMVSQALATSHNLILQVQATCHSLLPNIQGLPAALQEKVQQAYENMGELQISFSKELSESILTQTQEQVTKAQESLDELLEYVVQNAPLTWIVGPFAPAGDSTEKAEVPAEAEKAEA